MKIRIQIEDYLKIQGITFYDETSNRTITPEIMEQIGFKEALSRRQFSITPTKAQTEKPW